MVIIKKNDLVSIVQDTETFKDPKIELEQYSIDATCAVDIIYFAGFEFNDINDNILFDLGTGTGRLSIASAYFNPRTIISVDLDWNALEILKNNISSLHLNLKINPICSNIKDFSLSKSFFKNNLKITTIMNPPFGVKKKRADRIFLEKAFSFSNVVYSIHLSGKKNFAFISDYANQFEWIVDYYVKYNMVLEKSFKFHEKKTKKIDVTLYRFVKK